MNNALHESETTDLLTVPASSDNSTPRLRLQSGSEHDSDHDVLKGLQNP